MSLIKKLFAEQVQATVPDLIRAYFNHIHNLGGLGDKVPVSLPWFRTSTSLIE